MKRSGSADLPLHGGHVPPWLFQRMAHLGLAITESILLTYGKAEMIRRLSDPFWFQSLGAVMGMDWHSSGITTSVLGALKTSLNPRSRDLGIYICGGKGAQSRRTPQELTAVAQQTGLDAAQLVRCSRLSAKVDNTAVQDGFSLYLHNFIVTDEGDWAVIQQGMRDETATARRYHWHSDHVQSFIEEPHTGVCGINMGDILNLTAAEAGPTRSGVFSLTSQDPHHLLPEVNHLMMPRRHDVRSQDVDLKRLGAILWLAHERRPENFEELLLLEGLGPRTLQSLTLVSEVIYGTPSRFKDPARFSFAHGGKDGHPFPVPTKVYDETIHCLQTAVQKAKLGSREKSDALKKLQVVAQQAEAHFTVTKDVEELIDRERAASWKYGGKTVFGDAKRPTTTNKGHQLGLF